MRIALPSPASPPPVWVIERRRLAAATTADLLRQAGFPVQLATTPTAAADGALALWSLPMSEHDLSWLAEARQQATRLRLLTRGDNLEPRLQTELLMAGAVGYLEHSEPAATLLQATQLVADGGRWFSRAILSASIDILRAPAGARPPAVTGGPNLTEREMQVARRVALGEANKDIAAALGVTISTVKTHLQNIFAKLKVESRVALALRAAAQPHHFGLKHHRR